MKKLIKVKAIQTLFVGDSNQTFVTEGKKYDPIVYDDTFITIYDDTLQKHIFFIDQFELIYDSACKYNLCPKCGEELK